MKPHVSIIIPTYNEAQNVASLFQQITNTPIKEPYEIIFVDDGSTDTTYQELLKLHEKDPRVAILKFRRNFGQTAAMDAGIKHAHGNILVTLDADLQNDPADIPKLVAKLNEGYDCVSGWRWNRKDPFSKKLFSRIANLIRNRIVQETLHDSGCSLKAYKKECFDNLTLYGEMHRFIPTLLNYRGFKIAEVKVNHRQRTFGTTKYNATRILKGLFDLLFIKFWNDYSARPIHFFGTVAVAQWTLAILIFIEQVIKAILARILVLGPLLIFSGILLITGMLTFFFGFMFEILIRMYYQGKTTYSIENIHFSSSLLAHTKNERKT